MLCINQVNFFVYFRNNNKSKAMHGEMAYEGSQLDLPIISIFIIYMGIKILSIILPTIELSKTVVNFAENLFKLGFIFFRHT